MEVSELDKIQTEIKAKLYEAGIMNGFDVPPDAETMHQIVLEIVMPIIKREVHNAKAA